MKRYVIFIVVSIVTLIVSWYLSHNYQQTLAMYTIFMVGHYGYAHCSLRRNKNSRHKDNEVIEQ